MDMMQTDVQFRVVVKSPEDVEVVREITGRAVFGDMSPGPWRVLSSVIVVRCKQFEDAQRIAADCRTHDRGNI